MFEVTKNDVTFTYLNASNTSIGTGQSVTIPNLAPGTYTYYLELSTDKMPSDYQYEDPTPIPLAGYPKCKIPVTFTLAPTPNLAFDLEEEYCAEEPIELIIPSYNPAYKYSWWYNFTSIKADGNNPTYINVPVQGEVEITLKAELPNGCIYESTPQSTFINEANFNGEITPNLIDVCEGNVPTLSFSPDPLNPTPTQIIWMHDDEEVHTGNTYKPTESGSYWAVLVDANGCRFYGMSEKPAIVKVRKPPFVSISGETSVCFGEDTVLTGSITDPMVEYSWAAGTGVPPAYTNWVTGTSNLSLPLSGLAPNSYTYTLYARPVSDPSCTSSFEVTVTVHPQVAPPTVTYTLIKCQPYTLELSASGNPAGGTYNWSNGMTGQTIQVNHGGAYSVTYTAPSGCSATTQIQAPHSPERAMWIVPVGCYGLCGVPGGYLLGPLGQYDAFEWSVDGAILQSGSGTILNQPVIQPGNYQLSITHNGCTFYSNMPFIDPGACNLPMMASSMAASEITFVLSPNPTSETTTATYDMGTEEQKASSITIHDVLGVQRVAQQLNDSKGEVLLNVGRLVPGTYLVNLNANGTVVAQQKLIKK